MKMFFRITGAVVIIAAVIMFFVSLSAKTPVAALVSFIAVAIGLLFLTVSDLMGRVEFLQERLGLYEAESEENLPQKKCPKCEKDYDFDYPACPYCGWENNETWE